MPAPVINRRLTAIDSTFLFFERKDAPLHIGGISFVEGEISYDELIEDLVPRLDSIPRFRQKILNTPFHVGHPTWEYDPDFDIHQHVHFHQVSEPGGPAELQEVLTRIYSKQLDRKRALWEFHLIQGLEGARTAVASKVHHAMVDGVGGGELIARLLDIVPDRKLPKPKPYRPPSLPDSRSRVVDALWDNALSNIEAWTKYTKSWVEGARGLDSERLRLLLRAMAEMIPDATIPPKRLPFNRPGSGEITVTWTELSFAEARAIRAARKVSFNDVVLATLAGAVSKYAVLHGESVQDRTMRIMVPVNMRSPHDAADLGNQVSMIPVRLPLGIPNPVIRLTKIHHTMLTLKEAKVAKGLGVVADLMGGTMPAAAQAALGAIATSPRPIFNMVCTNVPGPQIPMYHVHRQVQTYVPMVPVAFDMGVTCAIFTYNQKMVFSFTVDLGACPDVDVLNDCLRESFEELREAAGVKPKDVVEIKPRKRSKGKKKAASKAEPKASAPEKAESPKTTPPAENGHSKATVASSVSEERPTRDS